MTDLYKEALRRALYSKSANICYLNYDHTYDRIKPRAWLEILGLLETLDIVND